MELIMSVRLTLDIIKERLKLIHGDSFDYPHIDEEFIGSTDVKITVICPIHNVVKKRISELIHDKACCPKCANLRRSISRVTNRNKAQTEMNRFYIYIKNKYGFKPWEILLRPNYKMLASDYRRLRLDDGYTYD